MVQYVHLSEYPSEEIKAFVQDVGQELTAIMNMVPQSLHASILLGFILTLSAAQGDQAENFWKFIQQNVELNFPQMLACRAAMDRGNLHDAPSGRQ
jgi:hypothetical protein